MNPNPSLHHRSTLMLLGLLLSVPACSGPATYSAEAIEAQVIDADTRKPLEGVIVTANWQLETGTLGGNIQAGQLMVMETVTGPDGKFRFPAWGPKTSWKGFLVNEDPQLLLFKPGYEYRRLVNQYSSAPELRTRKLRRSDWNGETIGLKRFRGVVGQWAQHLAFLKTSLGFAYNGENCEWRSVPRMLVAQHHEMVLLDDQKIPNTLRNLYSVAGQEQCESAQQFFRNYIP